MHIDGTNLILGRVASVAAKHALLGEMVIISNCDKLIISGSRQSSIARYRRIFVLGNVENGPFLPRTPTRFVKRVCKRMLPIRRARGRNAFRHIRCYVGNKEGVETAVAMPAMSIDKLPMMKTITVAELCKALGGKRLS